MWHPDQPGFHQGRAGNRAALNPDFNGERQAGVGFYQSTAYRGRRISSVVAYLVPQRSNPKLKVRTNCKAIRLTTEGSRVTGVVYRSRDGAISEVRAGREVVVAAGALSTPKILPAFRHRAGSPAEGKRHSDRLRCTRGRRKFPEPRRGPVALSAKGADQPSWARQGHRCDQAWSPVSAVSHRSSGFQRQRGGRLRRYTEVRSTRRSALPHSLSLRVARVASPPGTWRVNLRVAPATEVVRLREVE